MPAFANTMTVGSWKEAAESLKAFADGKTIYYGVGDSTPGNSVFARALGSADGGMGYYAHRTDARGKGIYGEWCEIRIKKQLPPQAMTKEARIDRYLKICDWARRRYTVNGFLVYYTGTKMGPFKLIENAAFKKYLNH